MIILGDGGIDPGPPRTGTCAGRPGRKTTKPPKISRYAAMKVDVVLGGEAATSRRGLGGWGCVVSVRGVAAVQVKE